MRHFGFRAGRAVLVVIGVTFLTFALLTMAPGDPAVQRAGMNATPEVVAQYRAEMGLDDPFPVRYARWLGNAVTLDFGESTGREGFTASELVRNALPKTIELMVLAELMALAITGNHPSRTPRTYCR